MSQNPKKEKVMTTATMAPAGNAIAELVEQIVADHEQKDASVSSREGAAVSVTLAVNGLLGTGGMNGWITYDRPGPNKIYAAAGKLGERKGLFAGGGAWPALVLSPDKIAGKTGTFDAIGSGPAGLLQMWIDGTPVFAVRLPVAGAGLGDWRLTGEVRFSSPQ
jgi:hypothetical protein